MRAAALLLALPLALGTGPVPAQEEASEEIVLGLSSDEVSITTTFDGSDLLIFGAVKRDAPAPEGPPLDVIAAVSGPLQPLVVRQADRRMGLWVNAGAVEVDAAPSFYAVATTGPLGRVLSGTEDLRHSVSIPRAIRAVGTGVDDRNAYLDALIRIREREGLYQVIEGAVDLEEETLFRAEVGLPANLVEGEYRVRILLTRGGAVVDVADAEVFVRKVGLERWLFALSREHPLAYGLLALGLAILAGWGAQAAFQAART